MNLLDAARLAAGKLHATSPPSRDVSEPPSADAGFVPEAVIAKAGAIGRLDLMAAVTADRARWFAAFIVLAAIALFSAFGWYFADRRFAENVRVAWVKLDPSGAYTVEFADRVRPVEFFQNTLESKIAEFVERRYRRNISTITTDYRFAGFFLSPEMVNRFLATDGFNAARVAAEMSSCKANCVERDIRVRVVQHRTQTPVVIPEHGNNTLYDTLVFITMTDHQLNGQIVDRRNAIVEMSWRLKGKNEIVADKAALMSNPLGIEVRSLDLKEDPTPLPKDDRPNATSN